MKVLLLCGYFEEQNEAEVIRHAKRPVEFSANQFQKKLIDGFRRNGRELYVLSAPFIGSYPNACDLPVFRKFREEPRECSYVPFNNLWGIRNFSRTAALRKAIRFFIEDPCREKMIVVYCPHTPFLEAAAYAKKKDPGIRICFYVPDLPDYMNLDADRSRLYDVAKYFDNRHMRRYMQTVDSYVLLTEHMKTQLPVGNKPYLVAEGIVDELPAPVPDSAGDGLKRIVYTGKLNEAFGIKELIKGFRMITEENFRLVLCGTGDCMAYAREAAEKDSRILVTGQVSPEEACNWQRSAAVLVNPRQNKDVYTRYSFPSKLIEYLMTGRPVAAYLLDGIPACYKDYLFVMEDAGPEGIRGGILRACGASEELRHEKYRKFLQYARDNLRNTELTEKLIHMTMAPSAEQTEHGNRPQETTGARFC